MSEEQRLTEALAAAHDRWKRYSDLYDTAEAANAENIKTIARLTERVEELEQELRRREGDPVKNA